MNILSISQVQNQNSSDFTRILPVQGETPSVSDKTSFSDYLRDAQKDLQKTDDRIPSENSEKVAKYEEKSDSRVEEKDEKEVQTEKKSEKNEKSEKTARKDSSDEEKNEKMLSENNEDGLKIAVQNINILENAKKLTPEENAETVVMIDETSVSGAENSEISEKMLSWIMSSGKSEEPGDDISNEDFAKMIDAAVEFIPGFESEEEKLESAQNLSANDPELFLKNIEQTLSQAGNTPENRTKLPLDDKKITAAREKKTDSKIAVHDLRTHSLFEEDSAKIQADKIVQKTAEKKEINLSMQRQSDGNMQMTMELAARAEQNITSSSNQAAGANGSTFQAMLSNAVQENAPDFVKAGNIVLKDNNQGTINLILRPEGLGNVKISLSLDDKNLSAQILVHTKEAMDAFKESIPSLKQAFTESGFETGSFDLNFSNNQQGFAQGEGQNQNHENAALFAQKNYGDFVTPSMLTGEAASENYVSRDYSVNIVA
ncbi:MAG: flagellar hook-length control protein FliK [Treponema sp.]|nr:flagellar hook-length control protein FliK [Treponema sp.]